MPALRHKRDARTHHASAQHAQASDALIGRHLRGRPLRLFSKASLFQDSDRIMAEDDGFNRILVKPARLDLSRGINGKQATLRRRRFSKLWPQECAFGLAV